MKFTFALLCAFLLGSNSVVAQETINGTLTHDGIEREYIMYIPDSYDGSEDVPLMFCFHGYTSSAAINFFYTGFSSIADEEGFILVHPQGTELDGFTHWNVGGWTTGSTVDDVGFTEALIDDISASYSIDAERVYSTGMSNGGYMSFLLACQLSERFAAVASVTGSMTNSTFNECNPEHPTPVLQIHGTSDGTVPYNGDSGWTKSIEDVLEYWADYNNCDTDAETTSIENTSTSDGSTVDHIVYDNGDNCASVEHFKVFGGDHDWPGAFGNMDIDASEEIWDFFSQYDINGLINCENSIAENDVLSFEIYPNPTEDQITIQSEYNLDTNYKVYSLLGQVVLNGKIQNKNNTIDLSSLSPDIYFIRVGSSVSKFVKK